MGADLDRLYHPLEGPEEWGEASAWLDGGQWAGAARAWAALQENAPAWAAMAAQGTRLAAAYQSGGLAGLYPIDDSVARRLVAGVASVSDAGPEAAPHVRALHAAVGAAGLGQIHAIACQPQVHHLVQSESGAWHDHVLGHGDLKHHPNHRSLPGSGWVIRSPVAVVEGEANRLAGWLVSPAYQALQPAARAAYALYALAHVGPFAAGNGRVGRAVASAVLLQAAGLPLWVPATDENAYRTAVAAAEAGDRAALVEFVVDQMAAVAALLADLRAEAGGPEETAALARWEARIAAGRRLLGRAAATAEAALARHSARTDLGWLSDLSGSAVAAGTDVRLVAPVPGGRSVGEVLTVDLHPLDGAADTIVLRAVEAQLDLNVSVAGDHAGLEALVDRAVTALALRAAAEA